MPPSLVVAAFMSRIFPANRSSGQAGLQPDQGDPEKGSSGSGEDKDKASNVEQNDGDDPDNEIDDLDEFEEPGGTESTYVEDDRSRQGVPLTSTGTMSSASMSNFSRPSLPRWFVKAKEVLFVTHHDNEEILPNYRRTPLISGSLIPFAILLEIPGLTEHWYVRTDGTEVIASRRNSSLVVTSMSLSLALAVLANIALIYRFLERRVKMSTIVCIIALTLHDALNIVIIIVFSVQHRANDGFTNGEAFWMTICSTIVSSVTNLTLIWDLVVTPNFDKAGSGVTRRQRSLVIITMVFLAYIAIGALITSLSMSLTFLNGLFFTIVTTLTIGFGDIVPKTPAQRVIVCTYAVLGIVILGAGIRITAEAVLEGLQVGYRRRLREFKRRRKARKREREQVRRWRAAVEERLVERGLDVWTSDRPALAPSPPPSKRPPLSQRGSTFVSQPMYLNTEALPPDVLESAAREAGVPPEKFIGRKFGRRARQYQPQHNHDQPRGQQRQGKESERPTRVPMDFTWTIEEGGIREQNNGSWWWERAYQTLRRESSRDGTSNSQSDRSSSLTYQEMVKTLEREERISLYVKLGLAWALLLTFWIIGSVIFSNTEGWGFGAAVYFCFISFTTIGYGDLAPETPLGRAIFVFWALFGVGAMTIFFAVVTDAFSSKYHNVTHDKKFDRAVRRYRQGQEKATRSRIGELRKQGCSTHVVPALQANLARISSREPTQPCSVPKPAQSLAEAEARLRSHIEPLPELILREVLRLRDHTRYFVISNGHADALSHQMQAGENAPPKEYAIPEDLKVLLDEIAQEEGFEERLKQEVWDDPHARNTLFLLSLEKGARKMVEAAELALEMLSERNELRSREEGTEGEGDIVEEIEET